MMGGGRGGVVSVCTDPGGVTLRRAVDMELLRFFGVDSILGCSAGVVNRRGGKEVGEYVAMILVAACQCQSLLSTSL